MTLEAGLAIGVAALCFAVLSATRLATHLVLAGGVGILLIAGVVDAHGALSGLANPAVVTIALLFIVAAGLRETGVISYIVHHLGHPKSVRGAQARLILPVATASGFVNNTPLVAMLMPAVRDWSKRIGTPVSKLLIPLSFASLLGGMCTLIGTSTNLMVHGLLLDYGHAGLSLFDVTLVGLPCAALGLIYLLIVSPALLPSRDEGLPSLDDPREFTVEMVVDPSGPIAGKTVSAAGLRNLPGCYLVEVHRRGRVRMVSPTEILDPGDQLVFVGLVDSIVDLQRMPGLSPATEQVFKLDAPRNERWFIEAVVSHRSPFLGQSIRDAQFRTRYNAAVLAVAREGERVEKKIGDIVLTAGDVLLLEAAPSFIDRNKNSNEFYLVSRATESAPPSHERAGIALAIFAAMVAAAAFELIPLLHAALLAAGATLFFRCTNEATARRAVDWQLLLTIAAAFGLGHALQESGAAQLIADTLTGAAGGHVWMTFAAVCVLSTLLTELITNNAAAALVFPIAMDAATSVGASPVPFAIGIMLAASACFATPLGYQTHLMVYGAGGYRFRDFLKIGVPLDLLMLAVIITLTPLVWPF